MPGTVPVVSDILECEVLTAFSNQIGVNILHYNVRTVVNGGVSLQFMANQYDSLIHANYKNVICNQATYRGIGLTNVTAPRTQQAVATANAGVGSGGANMIPTQVRGLISWYSNTAGRRFRGRTYIPFPPVNGATSAGDPLAAYVTLLDAVRVIMLGPLVFTSGANSTTLALGIYHRKDVPPTASDVAISVTRNRFATQRRSGAYGRANNPPF